MKLLIASSILLLLWGCSDNSDPDAGKYPQVFKKNAVEILLHTRVLPDGRTVFLLEKNLYVLGKQQQHIYVSADTLPDLGTEVVNVGDDDEPSQQLSKTQYDVLFKVDSLRD